MKHYRRIASVLFIVLVCTSSAKAQSKIGPYLFGQVGWVSGVSSGTIGDLAGGLHYRRWGLGLATGIDNVGLTSIPLLADIRWELIPKKHVIELFSQGGRDAVTQKGPQEGYGHYSGGLYWYGGLCGRLFSVEKAGSLWITIGVRYRQYSEIDEGITGTGFQMIGPRPAIPTFTTKHWDWAGIATIGWRL
jgi:hypothetical protein